GLHRGGDHQGHGCLSSARDRENGGFDGHPVLLHEPFAYLGRSRLRTPASTTDRDWGSTGCRVILRILPLAVLGRLGAGGQQIGYLASERSHMVNVFSKKINRKQDKILCFLNFIVEDRRIFYGPFASSHPVNTYRLPSPTRV